MKDFVKVAAITPRVVLGKPKENAAVLVREINKAYENGALIIATPELSITGYTLGDLFFQNDIINEAMDALLYLKKASKGKKYLATVGLPILLGGKLYNCVAVFGNGYIYGFVPKIFIPNYKEYYEKRWFESFDNTLTDNLLFFAKDEAAELTPNLIFECEENNKIQIGIEICEDLFAPNPPSTNLALLGANIILNSSASIETIGKADYRRNLVAMRSGSNISAYIYANAGLFESTTDAVFSGHNIIAENGTIIAENKLFTDEAIYSDIDLNALSYDRKVISSFKDSVAKLHSSVYTNKVPVSLEPASASLKPSAKTKFASQKKSSSSKNKLHRKINPAPFVPKDQGEKNNRSKEILEIQARGIITRLNATKSKKLVLGISGGLDSTLAFLACEYALEKLKRKSSDLIAVTLPCFGTTKRTKSNAEKLAKTFGADFREIDITKTVRSHFEDIKQDESEHSVTYENAQARVRTLTLFDIANKEGGLLIGTGDLSELALGWATYGGDHISSYGVNSGIPKTLVRYIIEYYMSSMDSEALQIKKVLQDILDTPVSPELLPPDEGGDISQKTEEIVGPYELHDFFLFHFLRYARPREQIFELAKIAFCGQWKEDAIMSKMPKKYSEAEIKKWLDNFYKRFYSNQFKRSCMPDGPKVGSVSLSPRADFRMPSDL